MDRGLGLDAQGVALAAPHSHALVEHGTLDGPQFSGAEVVDHLARHVEDDRKLRSREPLIGDRVLGKEVSDCGAADVVLAGESRDGPAFQVRGTDVLGRRRSSMRCRAGFSR